MCLQQHMDWHQATKRGLQSLFILIGKMCVQNGYHGTKLLFFDGIIPIVNEEFNDVKEYSIRLHILTGATSIIVGTIIAIHEEEGWLYIGCKGCKKKVIRSSDMVDLEADVSDDVTWKTFEGNTRDLGSILEETGQDYDFTPKEVLKNKSQIVEMASGKLVTPSGSASDRVRKIVTAYGL
ncbi:hypothetical protein Tco_1286377 [Tanacetum coccineum]